VGRGGGLSRFPPASRRRRGQERPKASGQKTATFCRKSVKISSSGKGAKVNGRASGGIVGVMRKARGEGECLTPPLCGRVGEREKSPEFPSHGDARGGDLKKAAHLAAMTHHGRILYREGGLLRRPTQRRKTVGEAPKQESALVSSNLALGTWGRLKPLPANGRALYLYRGRGSREGGGRGDKGSSSHSIRKKRNKWGRETNWFLTHCN